jgi:hypothetical protein
MPVRRPCLALIADIVDSRRFRGSQRTAVQRSFDATVRQLNRQYPAELLAPFVISRGDEFQGILLAPAIIPDLVWNLESWFAVADLRIGLGYGTLEMPPGPNVLQLDGQALHRAREALELAAKAKRLGGVFSGFDGGDPVLNGIARLLRRQRERMSARQRDVVGYLRQGLTQMAIARKLKLTKQAISDHARAAGWDVYHEGEIAWRAALAEFTSAPAGRRKS